MTRRAFLSLIVLIIYNTTTGSFDSKKSPQFLELQNSLFELITRRSRFSYKTQWFFNDSEIHQKNITSNSTRIIVFLLFFPYAPCAS